MRYHIILFITTFLITFSVQAQTPAETPVYKIHIVMPWETLSSVSKKYHTTPEELLKINPGLSANKIPMGTHVNVPVITAEMKKSQRAHEKMLKHAILYSVQRKETLYTIAKNNNTDVKTLMAWNNLSSSSVEEGQRLIVGFTNPKYAPKISGSEDLKEKNAAASNPSMPVAPSGKTMIKQEGAGEWLKDVNDDGNFYALHSTAPIGSLITVKNLMNNKTVTVKVIGKLPPTSQNEHVIIKLSASAAKALHILDDKFRVEISYAAK